MPTSKRLTETAARLRSWRVAVAAALRAHWGETADADLDAPAATIVGMFDAGARDREVAAFLEHQEQVHRPDMRSSPAALFELATRLHRLAGSRPSV